MFDKNLAGRSKLVGPNGLLSLGRSELSSRSEVVFSGTSYDAFFDAAEADAAFARVFMFEGEGIELKTVTAYTDPHHRSLTLTLGGLQQYSSVKPSGTTAILAIGLYDETADQLLDDIWFHGDDLLRVFHYDGWIVLLLKEVKDGVQGD